MKRTLFILLTLMLMLSACGASESAEAPAMDFDGGYSDEFTYERSDAEPGMASNTVYDEAASANVERLVIKNAELSIVVPNPAETMAEISTMAENMGGFVVSSNLYQTTLSSGLKVPHASITVRVPSERLDEAMGEIVSGTSEVLRTDVSGDDVTDQYTDLASRLRNYQAAESQLMEIMDSATETEDVLEVFNQLTQVREQIEVIQGQMQYYEQAAALSAIQVEITADAANQPLQIGGWQPVGVAKDAIEALIRTLQFLADMLIWFVICVLPIGLLIGLPLFFVVRAVRRIRKRRKQNPPSSKELETTKSN